MTTPQETALLDQRLAEVDEIIDNMMAIGATIAHTRDLDEQETTVLYADMLAKQMQGETGLDSTLLPLFIGRLLTKQIMLTSLLVMAKLALENYVMKENRDD
jgi:hypothetical protein